MKPLHINKRTLISGIPNTLDILSNLAIALPGIYLICKQKKLSFLSVPLSINGISRDSDRPGSFARSRALPSQPVVSENGLNPPPCIKF